MAAINWDDSLSVNVGSIDDQHKKLFSLINDFYDNIGKRASNENILKLIKGMKDYTVFHFTNEESYMRKYEYPEYEQHKKEHEVFISKVNALEEKVRKGTEIISFEVTNFLKDWIKRHIQETDKRYSDFFVANGIK